MDNADGSLLPGAYAFVHLATPGQSTSVTIPANTLLFRREGLQVGVLRNGHMRLVPVKIGRTTATRCESSPALLATDAIIRDPSDSLIVGIQ